MRFLFKIPVFSAIIFTPFTPIIGQRLDEVDSSIHEHKLEYRATKTRRFDLLHTKLEVSFDWKKQYLLGKADLTLKPYFYSQSSLTLDAKGMDIHRVMIKKNTAYQKVAYDYDGSLLTLNFSQTYERKDTIHISINYTAKPNELEVNGSEAITEDKGLYFINPFNTESNKPQQIWTQGETEANSTWFPTIDAPNERCTQEMLITVQSRFKTLSNGVLMYAEDNGNGTRTDYWKMDKPHAPYLFMMAIGEFAVVEDEWENVSLTYMVDPEYKQYAKDIFGNTPEMMGYFSKLLGYKYPWKKYAQVVVHDFVSGAMENTSASVFMEDLHKTKRELKDENWDLIIAHELFHQWFGDLVTTESWSNLTLNEGFADYSEYLWNEYKYGKEEADYNLLFTKADYLLEAEEERKFLIRYYYESREDMFDSHSYAKGALVLHMLRSYLGDSAFFASLRYYLNKHAFSSVEISDLRLAFEHVTGEDLNWFFEQWYLSTGHPILDVSHEYISDTLYLSVNQIQDLDSVPLFQLPLFIDVWVDNQKSTFPIVVSQESEVYKMYIEKMPQLVLFDAEKQLLAEVQHEKPEQEWLFQYTHSANLSSRLEALYGMSSYQNDSIKFALVNLALNDPFYAIKEGAISFIDEDKYKVKKFLPKVIELAKYTKSSVRAEAIYFLANNGFKKHKSIIYAALSDESYMVIGTALNAIVEAKAKLTPLQIQQLETIKNVDVVLPLAEYFSANKLADKFSWYVSKLTQVTGNELFYFIQYFSEFLINAPVAYKESAVSFYENIAINHSNYLVRLSAFQGLLLLSDIKGVNKRIELIKKAEKDGRLRELYRDM